MLELPLSALKVGAQNVRADVALDENLARLIASIRSVGLLQPLVVAGDASTGFEIVAGRRRFAALNALHEEGHLFDTVPCVVTDKETAAEASLAENYAREQMRSTQLWRAFVTVMESNPDYTDKDLATAFDLPIDTVRRTLRLGRVHPTIMDAVDNKTFRFDKADEILQAFAATEDTELQLAVFETHCSPGVYVYSRTIKQALGVKSNDLKLTVVGSAAYIEAGGRFERDLFETHDANAGRVLDEDLLDRLANEALTGKIAELVNGDESVKLAYDCPRDQYGSEDHKLRIEGERVLTEAQQKRADEITVRCGELDAITHGDADIPVVEGKTEDEVLDDIETERGALNDEWDELHANAPRAYPPGRKIAVPRIARDWRYEGDKRAETQELVFTVYWADKQAKKDAEAAAAAIAKATAGDNPGVLVDKKVEVVDAPKPELTQKAADTLAAIRKDLLKQACAEQADDLVLWRYVYVNAQAAAYRYSYGSADMGLHPVHTYDSVPLGQLPFLAKDKTFADFMAAPEAQRLAVASVLLSAMITNHSVSAKGVSFIQEQFGARAHENARRYWTPTAEFFDMLKKQVILDMIGEVSPELAAMFGNAKVAEVKALALDFFTGQNVDKLKLRLGDKADAVNEAALAFVPKWFRLTPPAPKQPKAKKPKAAKKDKAPVERELEPA